jgi:tetratricopeptide (TPR) repeat protein
MTRFFTELRRRRILPVAGAYLAAGFLAVEIVQFLLAQGNAPEWTSKLIAIAYVVGFPIAVFLAWVVQLDEEGVHRWDTPAGELRTVVGAVISGIVLTALLAWLIIPGGAPKPEYEPFPNSLAVLPLATGRGTTNELTIASTLYTVLLDGLDQSRDLTQIRLRINERPDDLVEFGRQFKVAKLLLGDVVRSSGSTRIDMRLLDVVSGDTTWSETIEWDATEIKNIGTRLANDVLLAAGLRAIEPEKISGTTNDDAYLAYVKGIEHQAVFSAAELKKAIEFLEQAIELDPSFIRAHAALASAREVYAGMSGAQGPDREALTAAAQEAADAAFALDENSADAVSVMARLSDNPLVQQQLLERALELEPDHPTSLHRYALLISERTGNLEQAERLLRRLLDLDPLDANNRSELGYLLWEMGRRDEAMAELEKSIELQPEMPQNYMWLGGRSFLDFGEIDAAIYFIRKAYALNPEGGFYAAFVAAGYADLGMRGEALAWLARAEELGPELSTVQFYRSIVRWRLGDAEAGDELFRDYLERFEDPRKLLIVRRLALADIRAGHTDAGIARLVDAFPRLNDPNLQLGHDNFGLADIYAELLEQAGKHEDARLLVERIIAFANAACAEGIEDYCNVGWQPYAIMRDRDTTLEALRSHIVDARSREDNYTLDDPSLDWLRDDPEFHELLNILQEDLAKQRAWIIEKECAGDMPPAPGIETTIDCD